MGTPSCEGWDDEHPIAALPPKLLSNTHGSPEQPETTGLTLYSLHSTRGSQIRSSEHASHPICARQCSTTAQQCK